MKLLVILLYFICATFASLPQNSEKWSKFKVQMLKMYAACIVIISVNFKQLR